MSCGDNRETHGLPDDMGKKENSSKRKGGRDAKNQEICVRFGREKKTT